MSILNVSPAKSSPDNAHSKIRRNEFEVVGEENALILRRQKVLRLIRFCASGVVLLIIASAATSAFWFGSRNTSAAKMTTVFQSTSSENEQSSEKVTKIACVGNSIQYFNDQPRFLEMLGNGTIQQNSCLRGGASLQTLLTKGNGMETKFHTDNAKIFNETTGELIGYDIGAPTVYQLFLGRDEVENNENGESPIGWDFAILNDYTQAPARFESRTSTIKTLINEYAPMFTASGAIPVFLMTWAYHVEGLKNSSDLGNVTNFTELLKEGYEDYAEALGLVLPSSQMPRIAPVGLAFYKVFQENEDMWDKLFHYDDLHPSPHGSFLEGCVLYLTMMGKPPPANVAIPSEEEGGPSVLWDRSRPRVMQPEGAEPLERPSVEEATYLLNVAIDVTTKYSFAKYPNAS